MENKLEKKFGLITAICMVVGIVVGSGVFFKAQNVLSITEGNMPLGILAWVIGGAVMLICALNFSTLATHFEKVNGIVDYGEATVGEGYAYFIAWFSTMIYYPGMTSVLAWVSARYTVALFGHSLDSGICMATACFYLCASYAVNALSPKLAGKFQVSTTFIKMIPLILIAVVGTVSGLFGKDAYLVTAFQSGSQVPADGFGSALFAGVVATAFAYEGWIIATSINAELRNAKRNLPLALTVGGIIIVAIYVVYYIGIAGTTGIQTLMEEGASAGFTNLLGKAGGTAVSVLIVVSCLGTLNGLMLAATRGMYAMAVRGQGPAPKTFSEVSPSTNMPTNSSVFGLLICGLWLFYFFGANLMETPLFGLFSFDSSELPIVSIYGFYIPIFVMYIKKFGKKNPFKNILMPVLGIIASAFMIFAAVWAHGITPFLNAQKNGKFSCPVLFYLILFLVIMLIGVCFYYPGKKKNQPESRMHKKKK